MIIRAKAFTWRTTSEGPPDRYDPGFVSSGRQPRAQATEATEISMNSQPGSSPLANRAFRLLFTGSSISAIGDQFTLVALPWLVLQLTGDPAQLGLVLAVMALPRAVFMLLGGSVVDRISPRRVLLNARVVNALLVGALALLVLLGTIHMWMLYGLAAGIGLSTAFAYPAGSALVPQLVAPQQLRAANSIFMGMRQLSMLIGPALAGVVIKSGSGTYASHGAHGTGIAFAVDAVSFLFSVASLAMIRVASDRNPPAPAGGMLAHLGEGIRALWADTQMRALVAYFAAGSVLVSGPLQVALPVLAKTRLAQGAAAYGILMTANACGMLLGSIVSGAVTRATRGSLGLLLLCADTVVGLAVASMSVVHSLAAGAGIMVVAGLLGGTLQISMMTWLQQRVPHALMGRTMSIVMFTFLGLAPLAAALAGGLLKVLSLTELLLGAGLSLSLIALFSMSRPNLRAIRLGLPAASAAE